MEILWVGKEYIKIDQMLPTEFTWVFSLSSFPTLLLFHSTVLIGCLLHSCFVNVHLLDGNSFYLLLLLHTSKKYPSLPASDFFGAMMTRSRNDKHVILIFMFSPGKIEKTEREGEDKKIVLSRQREKETRVKRVYWKGEDD